MLHFVSLCSISDPNKPQTIYKDPNNPSGNNVRVSSGNPNSPNSAQQKPYVKEVKGGKVVDASGKPIPGNDPGKTPESHIPLELYKFSPDL